MTKAEFLDRQQSLLEKLKGWVGYEAWQGRIPVGGPLNYTEKERREYRTHTEIKISYDGDPGERIPAYLLLPRGIGNERRPAIFAAHQCAWACDVGKEQVVGKSVDHPDQAYGLELVREGFVVLGPDSNLIGDRFNPELREQWQTPLELGNEGACCCGPGGAFWPPSKGAFDVMRGIDFLSQHASVDPERIGMIGHSRGAGTTLYAMPFDKRIKAGVISGGTGMGAPTENGFIHGLPTLDLLSLLVPRPFFEAVGTEDHGSVCLESKRDLPVEERMREKYEVYQKLKEFYGIFTPENRAELYAFEGGHRFPSEARKASYRFLKKHLQAA